MAVHCQISNNLYPAELAEYIGRMDKKWEKGSAFLSSR